ncbi:MAG: cytochrome ubiquinol oxidase subunit I [Bdellovibrionota bacterium]
MTDLLAARYQMAISLGFHIVFAAVGIAMPFLMAVSHFRWLKTRDEVYLKLTKAWSKGVAIFFATGAVSGTVLSFELGLLWPEFMKHAGAIIGMPFSWEGTAFFLEAIALGVFLYGWNRVSPWVHWCSGLLVGVSGVASGLFVICANAWMNSPAGFDWVNGKAANIDPWAAMFNDAALWQGIHMTIAAFEAVGFAVAGVHALCLLKRSNSRFHAKAFAIAMSFGSVAAIVQPIAGDFMAKDTARRQPLKLAAMEALFETQKGAPLIIGGVPSEEREEVSYALHIPKGLSFLAYGDFNAEVRGLKSFPKENWPPVLIVHLAFQAMVALGTLLAFLGFIFLLFLVKRRRLAFNPLFLKVIVFSTPLGFVAIEAGWIVTEVGRQPWIIYGVMRTSEALSPMPGLIYSMAVTTAVYLILSALVTWLIYRQIQAVEAENV